MGGYSGDRNCAVGESPQHPVTLAALSNDAMTVINDSVGALVEDADYMTDAESFGCAAGFRLAAQTPEDAFIGSVGGTPIYGKEFSRLKRLGVM